MQMLLKIMEITIEAAFLVLLFTFPLFLLIAWGGEI